MREPIKYTEAIKDNVKKAIETNLANIDTKDKVLQVSNVTFDPTPEPDNYSIQKQILLNQKTMGSNVYADIKLLNKTTGQVLDNKQKVKVGLLPTVTNRNSFIIGGKEYVVFNQLRLKPAIYTKYDLNSQPTADLNLAKGRNMSITYNPMKERFFTKIKSTNVPLYTILKDVYKVDNSELSKKFGLVHQVELEHHNKDSDKYLNSLHKIIVGDESAKTKTPEQISKEIKDKLDKTVMDPEINKMTMNKAYDKVSPDALITAAQSVLNIHKGLENPTYKDNIAFKSVHSTEDFLHEKITKISPQIKNELRFSLEKANKISDIPVGRKINEQINNFFGKSNLVNYAMQINPMEFLENAHKLTSLGEGAISDTNALPMAQRDIDVSHLGFIDIVRTPDNMRAGVDVRASLQAWKDGNTLKLIGFDKNQKPVELTPAKLFNKTFAMSGETSSDGKLYRAFKDGKMVEVPKSEIDYFINSDRSFTVTTGSIPYANSNQGQRNAMGAKMQTQALALKHREAPLVTTVARRLFEDVYVPKAKVDGTVSAINKDNIEITDKNGMVHNHSIPHNFPLNYHSYLHVDPIVSLGQKVKKDTVLGDHNFSKDGKLALGVNMDVAYMPYKGLNNDDAFVITQQGADKLLSLHTHSFEMQLDGGVICDLNKYTAYFPKKFSLPQLSKLDGAVVKKGTKLEFNDPIILAMRKKAEAPEVMMTGNIVNRISNPWSDVAIKWDKHYPAEVIDVITTPSFVRVIVKTESPMEVASKISGLYGNKGVIGAIVPNHLAPRKNDGSIPDVIMNPAAIPTRMNPAQVFETAMGKVIKAKKLPTIYLENFSGENAWKKTNDFLKKHGVSDTDKYFDPMTGKEIKYFDKDKKEWTSKVFNGSQYIMKLFKEAETSYSARAGGKYDIDMRPLRGGEEGSKAIGNLDFYGLLAHGNTRAILKEMSTYKAEYNPEFWSALLQGKPLPAPKPTFAFNKFVTMMQGMGINLQKDGHTMKLLPFTDKDILKMSSGEIKEPTTAMTKPDPETGLPFRPEKGGLFDPVKTGGLKGTRWTHMKLATPVVNAMYEKPIRVLTGLKQDEFRKIAEGSKTVNIKGRELTGGHAIKSMLETIDPKTKIEELSKQLTTTKAVTKRDDIIKQLKYLKPLAENDLKPHEAYILNYMPIIPPQFRPIYPKQSGELVVSDANHLYAAAIKSNNAMNNPFMKAISQNSPDYQKTHKELYNSIRKIQGLDGVTDQINKDTSRDPKGFLQTIIGGNAKYGYFQSKLVSKVQDIVGRAAITPSNDLGMDELGIPEKMGWKLYKPIIIGEMAKRGISLDKAEKEIENKTPLARNILQTQLNERPVILNRAPTLHKFNMMAFKPRLVAGQHIKTCPLINKSMNADNDGDSCLNSIVWRFTKSELNVDKDKKNCYYNNHYDLNNSKETTIMLTQNSSIRFNYGLVNLQNFPKLEETKRTKGDIDFYSVPEGIEVLTVKNGNQAWLPVESYSVHKNVKVLELETNTSRTIHVTSDHSLCSVDDNFNYIQTLPEVGAIIPRIRQIVTGVENDFIKINNISSNTHKLKEEIKLSFFFGFYLGAYIADGWTDESGKINISKTCPVLPTVLQDKCFPEIFETEVKTWIQDTPHKFSKELDIDCFSKKIVMSSKTFADLLKEWVGQGAHNKKLPEFWLTAPIEFKWGLLSGLINGDGTVSISAPKAKKGKTQTNVKYDTVSRTLAYDIVGLAHSLDLTASVKLSKTPKGGDVYVVHFNQESIFKMQKELFLTIKHKQETLAEFKPGETFKRNKYVPGLKKNEILKLIPLFKNIDVNSNIWKSTKTQEQTLSQMKINTIYAQLSRNKNKFVHFPLDFAKNILSYNLDIFNIDPILSNWKKLVEVDSIEWEVVESIKPIPHITEAYDLTIPPNYTMVTESGIVVWDSLNIHPVISPEAVKEAWNMLPSNNLFNPLNKNPMFMPDQESVKGLYEITTQNQAKPIAHFKTIAELKKAYKDGRIGINDTVDVEEIKSQKVG